MSKKIISIALSAIMSSMSLAQNNGSNGYFSNIIETKIIGNSIVIADCSENAYHPFSNPESKKKLINSIKGWSSESMTLNSDSTLLASKLDTIKFREFWCYSNECETKSSNILYAKITTNNVRLYSGLRVGMLKSEFFQLALNMKTPRMDTVIIESCVEDLQQCFIFRNNKLQEIQINSHLQE